MRLVTGVESHASVLQVGPLDVGVHARLSLFAEDQVLASCGVELD